MQNFKFSIADIILTIKNNPNMIITDSFLDFQSEKISNWIFDYQEKDELPSVEGRLVHRSLEDECILTEKNEIIHLFLDGGNNSKVYACTRMDYTNKVVSIQYLKEDSKFFSETGNSFYHSNWERVLIEEDRLLMHSSCVDTRYGGICFSGPSGIGKSTQSDLWIKYEDAKLINGDRPIIYKKDGVWKAYGSPYAGSSKIHINENCDIRCIVILKQGKVNKLRRLSVREAFRCVYSNMTANTWDQAFMEKVFDLCMNLITDIQVYELTCLPDKSAVDILKEELERGK